MSDEDAIQADIVNAVRYMYPKSIIFSVPNGGARNYNTGRLLKITGTLAGVADLILLHNGKTYFFEVKKPGGRQQPSQKDFQSNVEKQGFNYFIVTSTTQTINIIKNL
jgi:hypothetical protein